MDGLFTPIQEKDMNSLKSVILVLAVFTAGFFSGCGTIYGVASDIEEGSGWLRRELRPVCDSIEQERIKRAARLVLENEKGQ